MAGDRADAWAVKLPDLEAILDEHDSVALYGSVARGDDRPSSDIDVLVIAERTRRHQQRGRLSLTVYEEEHLAQLARQGSLFILHLKEEGQPLKDSRGIFNRVLAAWQPPDIFRTRAGMRAAAAVLDVPPALAQTRTTSLANTAVFVVRSALYLRCLELGQPAFGISKVAATLQDDEASRFLQRVGSREYPPEDTLRDARVLLARYLGPPLGNPCGTLDALAVSCHRSFPLASELAVRVITNRHEIQYASAPVSWWST